MADRNSFARTIHDLGLATWFGGSLMGAVGLNAAAKSVVEPTDRLKVANAGWARWTPVNLAGIGTYLAGATVLLWANKGRVAGQEGVGRWSAAKNVLTLVALGATAYSRVLGQRLMEYDKTPVEDGTTPSPETPEDAANVQRQLKVLQYAIPASVGGLIAISAVMGEQQRPTEVAKGIMKRLLPDRD